MAVNSPKAWCCIAFVSFGDGPAYHIHSTCVHVQAGSMWSKIQPAQPLAAIMMKHRHDKITFKLMATSESSKIANHPLGMSRSMLIDSLLSVADAK